MFYIIDLSASDPNFKGNEANQYLFLIEVENDKELKAVEIAIETVIDYEKKRENYNYGISADQVEVLLRHIGVYRPSEIRVFETY